MNTRFARRRLLCLCDMQEGFLRKGQQAVYELTSLLNRRIRVPVVRLVPLGDGDIDANALLRCSIEKRVGLLAVISKDQVTLAKRTAAHELHRIDAAGIIFNDSDEIFIFGSS